MVQTLEKDTEFKSGLTGQSMKDGGKKIRRMELGDLYMLMEMYLRESGKTTKLMDLEFTLISMEQGMREHGLKIGKMGVV